MEARFQNLGIETLIRGDQYTVRTPGLHLSSITKFINRTLDPKRFDQSQPDWARVMIGMMFERVLEDAMVEMRLAEDPSRFWRPGEIEVDGVIMTPDNVDVQDQCIEEWKATYMSSMVAPDTLDAARLGDPEAIKAVEEVIHHKKFRHWVEQGQCYARALSMTIVRIRALFLAGNHWKPISPQFISWDLHFQPHELDETWDIILNHRHLVTI